MAVLRIGYDSGAEGVRFERRQLLLGANWRTDDKVQLRDSYFKISHFRCALSSKPNNVGTEIRQFSALRLRQPLPRSGCLCGEYNPVKKVWRAGGRTCV
jgi:hypothetical protein